MCGPYSCDFVDSAYYFKTIEGLEYKAYFIDYSFIPGTSIKLLQFSFEPIKKEKGCFDPRVGQTIAHLLLQFFSNYDDVVIIVFDDLDQRSLSRKRLFNKWYQNYASGIDRLDITLSENESTNECFALFRENADFKNKIVEFFSETAS